MSSRTFFIYFIFITIFLLAFLPTIDPDFFWHLRTGKYILELGFPQGDPYSFTKFGSPWHLHEWLSEVLIYKIQEVGGEGLLSLFFSSLIVLTFVLVYLRTLEKPYLAGITTFIVAFASSVSWGVRPQIFNMLFASLFIFILEKIRGGNYSNKKYGLLFLLLIVWINLHAGAILGLVLIFIYVGLNFAIPLKGVKGLNLPLATSVVVLAFVSLLISPHGFDTFVYPIETLTSSAMKTYIDEWHSPDFHSSSGSPFYFLLLLTIFTAMISKAKPSLSEGVLILGSLSQALMSYRNIPFFCICVGPYLSRALGEVLSNFKATKDLLSPLPRRESSLAKLVFSLLFIAYSFIGVQEIQRRIGSAQEEISKNFPTNALATLKNLNPKRIFNYHPWGGYLIWNNIPVFIDGRADMYGDEFFTKYIDAASVKKSTTQVLNEFDIDYVLSPTDSSLVRFLKASGEYREVYSDKVATILERSGDGFGDNRKGAKHAK